MLSSGSSSDLTLPRHQQEGLWHISQVPLCQPQPVQPLMQLPHKTAPVSSASSSAVESPCPASPAHHHHHHLTTCKPELQFRHCSPAILCQDQLWCTTDLPQPGCPGPAVPGCPQLGPAVPGVPAAAQPAPGGDRRRKSRGRMLPEWSRSCSAGPASPPGAQCPARNAAPAPPEMGFNKHGKYTTGRAEKFSLECSTILVVVLREKWAREEQLAVSYRVQGDTLRIASAQKNPFKLVGSLSTKGRGGTVSSHTCHCVCAQDCVLHQIQFLASFRELGSPNRTPCAPCTCICQHRGTSPTVRLGTEELKNNLVTPLLLHPLL